MQNNTLHIFGDSFASDYHKSWTRQVASNLNLSVSNYAMGGTSIEWSMVKFLNTKFKDNDVVIFVLSQGNRFDIEPFMSSKPMEASTAKDLDTLSDYNKWYVLNRSQELLDLKPTIYTSVIYTMSQKFPNVKFVVISGFVDSKNSSIINETDNFLMLDSVSLNEISHFEVNETKLNPYMLYNVCGRDPRINHLTNRNLDNLASSITDAITLWDRTQYNEHRFSKNLINTHVRNLDELYLMYVDTNLLDSEWIQMTKMPVSKIQGSKWHRFKQWILEL